MKVTNRNSNVELLRLFLMLSIIINHLCYHTEFTFPSSFSINRFVTQALILGNIANNLFFLISGYYLIKSNSNRRIKKVINIWLVTVFYSVVLYLIVSLSNNTFNVFNLLKSFLPMTNDTWWFAVVYIVIIVLSKYLNLFATSISKKEYFSFLFLMSIVYVFIPTFTMGEYGFSRLLWGIYMYLIGGYISLYNVEINRKKIILAILCFVLTLVSIIVFDYLSSYNDIFSVGATYFTSGRKLLYFIVSILIFTYVVNLKPFSNRWINLFSQNIFGVYLIHEYYPVIMYLCKNVVRANDYININPALFTLHIVLSGVVIFVICLLIELLRNRLLSSFFENLSCSIERIVVSFFSFLKNIVESILF